MSDRIDGGLHQTEAWIELDDTAATCAQDQGLGATPPRPNRFVSISVDSAPNQFVRPGTFPPDGTWAVSYAMYLDDGGQMIEEAQSGSVTLTSADMDAGFAGSFAVEMGIRVALDDGGWLVADAGALSGTFNAAPCFTLGY